MAVVAKPALGRGKQLPLSMRGANPASRRFLALELAHLGCSKSLTLDKVSQTNFGLQTERPENFFVKLQTGNATTHEIE